MAELNLRGPDTSPFPIAASNCSRVVRSTSVTVPLAGRPYGWSAPYSSAISASIARTAGLSASWRMDVTTSPFWSASSNSGTLGDMTISATSDSRASKSSDRHVQVREKRWRVTAMPSEAPRLSRASVISAADRVTVPRSIVFPKSNVAPAWFEQQWMKRTQIAAEVNR